MSCSASVHEVMTAVDQGDSQRPHWKGPSYGQNVPTGRSAFVHQRHSFLLRSFTAEWKELQVRGEGCSPKSMCDLDVSQSPGFFILTRGVTPSSQEELIRQKKKNFAVRKVATCLNKGPKVT